MPHTESCGVISQMRVYQAGIFGVVVGLAMSTTSFSIIEQLMVIIVVLSVLTVIMGRKMITGPLGGFIGGFAAGYSLGLYIF